MRKKLSLLALAVASLLSVSMYAENPTTTSQQQSSQQVQQVVCAPETYCGPQTCVATPCYTDTVCNATAVNPVPCAPVPCATDTVCAPSNCTTVTVPAQTPAVAVTTGCGGC